MAMYLPSLITRPSFTHRLAVRLCRQVHRLVRARSRLQCAPLRTHPYLCVHSGHPVCLQEASKWPS